MSGENPSRIRTQKLVGEHTRYRPPDICPHPDASITEDDPKTAIVRLPPTTGDLRAPS
jgi:hypothetical protein